MNATWKSNSTFVLAAAIAFSMAATVFGQSAFTYQGRLQMNGAPLEGMTDIRFRLHNDEVAGSTVGPARVVTLDLVDGEVTATIDFGNAFNGESRWLSIAVRNPAGSGTYTTLSPRQAITSAPYAAFAYGPWLSTPGQVWYNGNVGIGTDTPAEQLHVVSSSSGPAVLVEASATSGRGIESISTGNMGYGLVGQSTNTSGTGVFGSNDSGGGTGVYGFTFTGVGVRGLAQGEVNTHYGVEGIATGVQGTGVYGRNNGASGTTYGVRGLALSPDGWAGHFEGRGYFSGNLGLGIENPTQRLHVSGNIRATGNVIASGNVGIGVNNPTERLDVAGTIRSNNVSTSAIFGTGLGLLIRGSTQTPTFDFSISETSGNVGIARTAVFNKFEVEGNASKTTAGNWLANSDARIKSSVETIENALDTLDRVRLVSFDYVDWYKDAHPAVGDRRHLNVIAQEFAEVFPEYVKSSGEKLPNGDDILQVDTYPLTIYSAAAVQELHAVVRMQGSSISELRRENQQLQNANGKLLQRLEKIEAALNESSHPAD
ncbi:MAG: tail fiber domain-containing protein [Phycisphaerae bacterium]